MKHRNKMLGIMLTFVVLGPLVASSKVLLIKQWHLLSSQKTLNIQESLSLPQAKNQIAIYKKLKNFINTKKQALLLYEGCEGLINESFAQSFQGWNYKNLEKKIKFPENFSKILTHLGLKLEVEFKEKADNRCGDDKKLIEENQLAFSDLKAFLGYLQRLEQFKNNPEKFEMYAKSMLDGSLVVQDPIAYALEKSKDSLKKVKNLIKERNQSFIKIIKENKNRNIAVVIGGLHIKDLSERLNKEEIPYSIFIPEGYPKKDTELLEEFEKTLFKK